MLHKEINLAICSLPSQAELLPAFHCHSARPFNSRRYSKSYPYTHPSLNGTAQINIITYICLADATNIRTAPPSSRRWKWHLRRCSATAISATSEKARHARVDICCGTSCVLDLFHRIGITNHLQTLERVNGLSTEMYLTTTE